jgi:Lambda phage tail tube protein, TTP
VAEVTTPIIGYGFEFAYSTDGGTTYVTFGEIEDLVPPGGKCKDVDISYVQMSAPWRLFMAGLADGEESTFKLIFTHTKYAFILTNIRVNLKFKITYSDLGTSASTTVFFGYVNGIKNVVPLDDKVMCDVSIKVSGAPVFTAGT